MDCKEYVAKQYLKRTASSGLAVGTALCVSVRGRDALAAGGLAVGTFLCAATACGLGDTH